MCDYPKITFGIIVVNGEPFTRYCLRSLYPFAHEIIVVEGGDTGAAPVTTADGHSIDGTLATLLAFKRDEDPEGKVQVITRDGHWPQKDELGRDRTPQSRAYAHLATGDYLWQVDIDEFYHPKDMRQVMEMLKGDPSTTAMSFRPLNFWGGIHYVVEDWKTRRGNAGYHRLFKWGPGYRYETHEPPTVRSETGIDLRTLHWVPAGALAKRGVFLYHYTLLFPWQVWQKVRLYQNEKPGAYSQLVSWADDSYFQLRHPYRVHNYHWVPSWLDRYHGKQPPEVERMMDDIRSGRVTCELRQTEDIERLLNSWWYGPGRFVQKALDPIHRIWLFGKLQALRASHVPRRLYRNARGRHGEINMQATKR